MAILDDLLGGPIINWPLLVKGITILFWAGLIGIVFSYLYRVIWAKYQVEIFIQRGKSYMGTSDLGVIRKNKAGHKVLRLVWARQDIPIPNSEYIYPINKAWLGRQGKIYLIKYGEHSYTPIKLEEVEKHITLTPIENHLELLNVVEQDIKNKYTPQEWWNRYSPLIMFGIQAGTLAILFLILLYIISLVETVSGNLSGVSENFIEAAKVMGQCYVGGSS